MATDYLNRMYWPKRGSDERENFTTYGRTIAMSAKLSAVNRKDLTLPYYQDRHAAFMEMLAQQRENGTSSRGSRVSNKYHMRPHTSHQLDDSCKQQQMTGNRSKHFMASSSFTDTPLDIALYHGAVNDPFVPNNSYKQYVLKKQQRDMQGMLPDINNSYEVDDRTLPPHRLYYSAGGYNDAVKAANHIRYYRPQVSDMSEYKVRQGRNGGVWRHVKEVMQGKGERIMFVDGTTSIDDLARVKNKLVHDDIRTPQSSRQPDKQFTVYVTPQELKASEGVNYKVIR